MVAWRWRDSTPVRRRFADLTAGRRRTNMEFEIDHLFVCVTKGGPEAGQLADAGFLEGAPNAHPGQGTACRRFFFDNAYLELLWIESERDARSELVRRTRLWERARHEQTGRCPFGIALRTEPTVAPDSPVPFVTWRYQPPYLPPGARIDVAVDGDRPEEPLVFVLSPATKPMHVDPSRRQPLDHPNGSRVVTGLTIAVPPSAPPPVLASLERRGLVSATSRREYCASLELDGARQRAVLDCRPAMPLVVRW
jgi:hypothetical protein